MKLKTNKNYTKEVRKKSEIKRMRIKVEKQHMTKWDWIMKLKNKKNPQKGQEKTIRNQKNMYQNMKKINIKGLLWKFRGKDTKFEEEKEKKGLLVPKWMPINDKRHLGMEGTPRRIRCCLVVRWRHTCYLKTMNNNYVLTHSNACVHTRH